MKYQAKKTSQGTYAVFTGSKYFPSTETDDEKEAKIRALEMSAKWYQEQIDKAQIEWESLGGGDSYDWGDVLA